MAGEIGGANGQAGAAPAMQGGAQPSSGGGQMAVPQGYRLVPEDEWGKAQRWQQQVEGSRQEFERYKSQFEPWKNVVDTFGKMGIDPKSFTAQQAQQAQAQLPLLLAERMRSRLRRTSKEQTTWHSGVDAEVPWQAITARVECIRDISMHRP